MWCAGKCANNQLVAFPNHARTPRPKNPGVNQEGVVPIPCIDGSVTGCITCAKGKSDRGECNNVLSMITKASHSHTANLFWVVSVLDNADKPLKPVASHEIIILHGTIYNELM